MASNTFTKTYILERIEARKASLKRQIDASSKILNEFNEGQKTKIGEWLTETDAWIVQVKDAMKAADRAFTLSSTPLEAAKSTTALAKLIMGGRYNTPPQIAQQRGNPYFGNGPIDTATKTLEAAEKELDALEHTHIYLTATPVEEFSLTGIKQLGLLDAIKFNLADAKAAGK